MNIDEYAHLPVRQWLFVKKLVSDLQVAENIAANAAHIKDYQRWKEVVVDLKNDIARASKQGWRP